MSRNNFVLALLSIALFSACTAAQPTAALVTEEPDSSIVTPAIESLEPTLTAVPPTAPLTEVAAGSGDAKTFTFDPSQTTARFVVNEVLAGQPNQVVGSTSDVEGSFTVDLSNTASINYAPVRVDMSTLATDSDMRNRTMHGSILETGKPEFRYAEFVPSTVIGLPESVEIGVEYPIKLSGNLTMHGVTREVTFEGNVTATSENQITGLLTYTFNYADFNVTIFRLPPQVASVEDQARLELEFAATSPQ